MSECKGEEQRSRGAEPGKSMGASSARGEERRGEERERGKEKNGERKERKGEEGRGGGRRAEQSREHS